MAEIYATISLTGLDISSWLDDTPDFENLQPPYLNPQQQEVVNPEGVMHPAYHIPENGRSDQGTNGYGNTIDLDWVRGQHRWPPTTSSYIRNYVSDKSNLASKSTMILQQLYNTIILSQGNQAYGHEFAANIATLEEYKPLEPHFDLIFRVRDDVRDDVSTLRAAV
ncbi:MAG: hypothetical protein M1813_002187 [Trichoglossum hirsutum]|nr:MAG: hypothetical protein M1813_002187 [Trichoglossum hirsutum]